MSGILAEQILHLNGDSALSFSKKVGSNLKTFYDFTPSVTGTIREHLMSEIGSPCLKYERGKSGTILPSFAKQEQRTYQDVLFTSVAQRKALEFVKDFAVTFKENVGYLFFRKQDITLPFEFFLHKPMKVDMELFSQVKFEDEIWAGIKNVSLSKIWSEILYTNGLVQEATTAVARRNVMQNSNNASVVDPILLQGKTRIERAMVYIALDRGYLKGLISKRLARRVFLLKGLKSAYKLIRKIGRPLFMSRHLR